AGGRPPDDHSWLFWALKPAHGRAEPRANNRRSALIGWAPASNADSPCVKLPWCAAIIMPGWCRLYPGPGCLAAVRAERHNGQGRVGRTPGGPGEPGDGGAGERDLRDVVAAAHRGRAVPLAHPHLHPGDHHALAAEPSDVLFQSAPGVVPPRLFTSSVQPATSTLPHHQRAWPASPRSSCRHPIEMPTARPAGTHPAVISLAKSCPETSQVKSARCPCAAPGARTAVPAAAKSSPLRGSTPRDSRTPTTPCPPSAAHSAVIRSMAVCRARYMASTSGPNDPASCRPDTWVAGPAGLRSADDPHAPGQLDPLTQPAAKTAAPNTCPTGSKPTPRTAMNS